MHPVLCIERRVHNVVGIPDSYDNPKGARQLTGSIVCAKEFQREVLDRGGDKAATTVLKMNERIARLALESAHARTRSGTHQIDVASAMLIALPQGSRVRRRRDPVGPNARTCASRWDGVPIPRTALAERRSRRGVSPRDCLLPQAKPRLLRPGHP
jgi:hypothetical protein